MQLLLTKELQTFEFLVRTKHVCTSSLSSLAPSCWHTSQEPRVVGAAFLTSPVLAGLLLFPQTTNSPIGISSLKKWTFVRLEGGGVVRPVCPPAGYGPVLSSSREVLWHSLFKIYPWMWHFGKVLTLQYGIPQYSNGNYSIPFQFIWSYTSKETNLANNQNIRWNCLCISFRFSILISVVYLLWSALAGLEHNIKCMVHGTIPLLFILPINISTNHSLYT